MSAPTNTSSSVPETVKGAGQWATGKQVREIEGHFDSSKNPDNTPISQEGGVPGVDFADKVKDKVTGHKSAEQA